MPEKLSLVTIAELKSLAESDAKIVLKRLLDLRKAGRQPSIDDLIDAKAVSVQDFCERNGITKGDLILACAKFYGAEFDRQINGLFDVGCAALGIEVADA